MKVCRRSCVASNSLVIQVKVMLKLVRVRKSYDKLIKLQNSYENN